MERMLNVEKFFLMDLLSAQTIDSVVSVLLYMYFK